MASARSLLLAALVLVALGQVAQALQKPISIPIPVELPQHDCKPEKLHVSLSGADARAVGAWRYLALTPRLLQNADILAKLRKQEKKLSGGRRASVWCEHSR
jgi:hypothetical protein